MSMASAPKVTLPYRPGVGIMLLNPDNRVFVGQRYDFDLDAWQMPQGGIDADEDPRLAALRELREETGILPEMTRHLAETAGWLAYDFPDDLMGKVWGGRYRGQKQKWYALRFLGMDSDIDLMAEHLGAKAEFSAWKWVPVDDLCRLIVPFKRQLYTDIIAEIAPR